MRNIILMMMIFTNLIYSNNFDRLNSSPTQEMLLNQKSSKLCDNPAMAKENFDNDFKYGCFCGKNYPNIKSDTKKEYKYLSRMEKDKLIAKYYSIKPYDDIDNLCMQHDICYIYEGREDQLCNDVLYSEMRTLSNKFYEKARGQDSNSKDMRCERLSSDIAVIFKTIFGAGSNLSMMRFGMFMMVNTPMTVMSKGIQKMSHGMNDSSLYPLPNEKCNL
ncbi:hypothetical protein MNB_SV-9-801 [hydrothermal vent metagenome]|uniref:Uncharacterized protein n=1 Tax=hydrothermal vent metagenome TaxID=652676 RepID=A0A1W1C380_9ZZZZ